MNPRPFLGISLAVLTLADADNVFDWIQAHPLIFAALAAAAIVIALAALPNVVLGQRDRSAR